jgi:hypothetical protein
MSLGMRLLILDVLECAQERILVRSRECLIGHREEALILLGNVLPQHARVAERVGRKSLHRFRFAGRRVVNRAIEDRKESATLVVFGAHHSCWAEMRRETFRFHQGKEMRLFLNVVATIGKRPKEVNRLTCRFAVQLALCGALLRDLFQAAYNLLDNSMFVSKDVSR